MHSTSPSLKLMDMSLQVDWTLSKNIFLTNIPKVPLCGHYIWMDYTRCDNVMNMVLGHLVHSVADLRP